MIDPSVLNHSIRYDNNAIRITCQEVFVDVIIIGLIVAIVGVFWDVVKIFKKDLGVDTKYLSNERHPQSLRRSDIQGIRGQGRHHPSGLWRSICQGGEKNLYP